MAPVKYSEDNYFKYLEYKNEEQSDLFLCQCGIEECLPEHSFGPAVRNHYLIHFILKGKGCYIVENKKYNLTQNQGFLICPDTLTYYEADKTNPWTYIWIGFNGFKAKSYLENADLNKENLIFNYAKKPNALKLYIDEILKLKNINFEDELKREGLLYLFLAELVGNTEYQKEKVEKQTDIYIKKAIEYIEHNYIEDIKITDIANFIGVNRSYLFTVFKKNLNISPQEFLLNYRMEKAYVLLNNDKLSISDIARSVGYRDPLNFSKMFKKINGVSPKAYREKINMKL
ncbi:AraC family transcriptional regulator [Sarcina ventriculi]|uniref:AraC family transcriptional regulator n=1 Tax=Sarcina ventriculi TaxID=1267 RepID=UPI00073E7401|nr:AraC family transcriptional regulator [Sarcina ventriculi]